MTHTKLIEAAAKAMCIAYGIDPDAASLGSDGRTRRAWEARINEARAAASVIIEACVSLSENFPALDHGSLAVNPHAAIAQVAREIAAAIRALDFVKEG